ncbi:hypothetical protein J3Q64DRAFT_1084785 [Phycomyces blakesleeanus]|uniref:Uncharacterized protein n=2 Tax=Phycomyces blakesleeanus TaxID=4837 RepID=A0A167QL18_PHYB8|nr:hypothetical protein PHYBLDRAFT_184953 [Phycomyces blakesleeanus NRRL 1555(-)]OAD79861.1 hypothetical protein PHYBLDRAFT_184953 [Phycomyces blakesleeanus NRRL 1555(-)]|eukprot:XP_018297901.1 hypothetical protein PHYBLDRAFT_184953 [Phycomyces blakesleeanus NRRL 1555(-)]
MKFSLAATSALVFATLFSVVKADEYAAIQKEWCGGLSVPFPSASTVVVAGSSTKVTVSRVPNSHVKTVTGLDLYSVDKKGKPKYVQNIWAGSYKLNKSASIPDTIPKASAAGLYYYRVWVSNSINGMRGPDCIETSHTFKVTSSSHSNADGSIGYAEALTDASYYHPDFFRGCFGLTVDSPQEGQTYKLGEHLRITANRDTSSQTDNLYKVTLYKNVENGEAEEIDAVWQGNEIFGDAFTLKDHLVLPDGKLDEAADYFYKLDVGSNKDTELCSFNSKLFKISSA